MDKKDINITITGEGHSVIKLFKLDGILDTLTTPKLDAFMSGYVHKEGICVILDCSDLSYINSFGLASLILYHIQLKRRGSVFMLIGLNDFIRELMEASGASKLIDIYSSKEEAIKNCKLAQNNA